MRSADAESHIFWTDYDNKTEADSDAEVTQLATTIWAASLFCCANGENRI